MPDENEPGTVGRSAVGDRLAAEIDRGDLSPETMDRLRSALGPGAIPDPDPDGSVEARLRHLQSEVETVAAYNDAIEGFLDEHGIASQFVANAREDLDAIERRLDALDTRATRRADRLDDLEAVVKRRRSRLDRLETRLGELAEQIDGQTARLGALEEDIEDLQEWKSALGDVFD